MVFCPFHPGFWSSPYSRPPPLTAPVAGVPLKTSILPPTLVPQEVTVRTINPYGLQDVNDPKRVCYDNIMFRGRGLTPTDLLLHSGIPSGHKLSSRLPFLCYLCPPHSEVPPPSSRYKTSFLKVVFRSPVLDSQRCFHFFLLLLFLHLPSLNKRLLRHVHTFFPVISPLKRQHQIPQCSDVSSISFLLLEKGYGTIIKMSDVDDSF